MSKFLYKPLKPWFVGQRFGEDTVCTDGARYVSKPTTATCPTGFTSLYASLGLKGHNGLDIGAWRGQPVSCAAEGRVHYVETTPGSGLAVEVVSKVGDRYFKHIYGHLQGVNVSKGQEVGVGALLGWADSTGMSTGDHLHFGLKECTALGKTLNKDNGYKGAIDPAPLMFDAYAIDAAPLLSKYKELLAQLIERLSEQLRSTRKATN